MKLKIFLLLILFLSSGVLAVAGVTPGSYKVDYEDGLDEDFVFDFYVGRDYVKTFVDGDLSEYVELSEDKIYDREKVVASVSLPSGLELNGVSEIKIGAGEAVGYILVNFREVNEFFDVDLRAPNANVGDIVEISFAINSENSLNVSSELEIYSEENLEIPIDVFYWDDSLVLGEKIFYKNVGTLNYSVGNYLAVLTVGYEGREFRYENYFSLGSQSVEIVDYTKELREDKVGKFDIDVKSLWNDEIKSLYAEVVVVGTDYKFVTSSVSLEPWGSVRLEGFFDTSQVVGYNKKLDIILYHDGKIEHEVVDFSLSRKFDFSFLLVVLVVVGVCVFLFIKGKSVLNRLGKLQREVD